MYIQMVTALVLQLIQCVVHLPSEKDADDEYDKKVRTASEAYCHQTISERWGLNPTRLRAP